MKRFLIASALALVLLVPTGVAPPPGGGSTLPSRMSALGDSITRAYNVDSSNWIEHPEHSFSTGYDSGDIVNSHYEHIKKKQKQINGNNFNDAESGAKMEDLSVQADRAIAHAAQYITIEMGGNDLCTGSLASMTTPETFRTQFRAGADKIKASLPTRGCTS